MCTLGSLGSLWGAAVEGTRTWAAVPADLQPRLIEAAQRSPISFCIKSDAAAMERLTKKYGLKINTVTPQAEAQWVAALQKTFSGPAGKMYGRESFEMATRYRTSTPPRQVSWQPGGPGAAESYR